MARVRSVSIISTILGHFTTAPLAEVQKDLEYLTAIVGHRSAAAPPPPLRAPRTQSTANAGLPAAVAQSPVGQPAGGPPAAAPAGPKPVPTPRPARVRNRSGRGPGRPRKVAEAVADAGVAQTVAGAGTAPVAGSTPGRPVVPAGDAPAMTLAGPVDVPLPPMEAAEDPDPAADA